MKVNKSFSTNSQLSTTKGFTLIELLVVIAVIGVLAAGVLAAINPVKRINQANDAKIKNDIGQISRAMQAYFTSSGGTGLTPWYPGAVVDLVTNTDLKTEPKAPGGVVYTVEKTPGTCTTAGKNCVNVTVSFPLKEPVVPGDIFCWRSADNSLSERTPASCTP